MTTTLQDLFAKVKEENLNKYQLEELHQKMSEVKAQAHLELGSIKKKRAMYEVRFPEKPVAVTKREWYGLPEGQRELELKAMLSALGTHLQSLKSRLYTTY